MHDGARHAEDARCAADGQVIRPQEIGNRHAGGGTAQARFSGDMAEARAGLRELLTDPMIFTPCVVRGYQAIRFKGRLGLEGVFGGELVVTGVASPTRHAPNYVAVLLTFLRGRVLRRAT